MARAIAPTDAPLSVGGVPGAAAGADATRAARTAATAALFGVGWGANQFAPLLLVYHHELGVGEGTLTAIFGVYALGLIPGLLVGGPLSDRVGRRAVVVPAAVLSVLATVTLMFGGSSVAALFAGRLLAGIVSGAVFSAATTWLRETSLVAGLGASAASRTAAAMSAGFGLGPLVAGAVAQWAPAPTVLPYVPHLLIMIVVLALLRTTEPDAASAPDAPLRRGPLAVRREPRFRGIVVPLAPWAFAAPVIAFALLPPITGVGSLEHGIALAAVVTAITALSGAAVQPAARRLGLPPVVLGCAGLLLLAAGCALGALAAASDHRWLLVPIGLVLGCAYGLCLVGGLIEVQRLARPDELARATSVYYALTYLGFAAPYLLTRAHALAGYPELLLIVAGLALATAALIAAQDAAHPARA